MALEFDTKKGDDLETIRERLAGAVAWFRIVNTTPGSGFPRSSALAPSALLSSRKWVVESVTEQRSDALKESHQTQDDGIGGRLLGYEPDGTVFDGASQSVTGGFFNVYDEPPWDLWIGYLVEIGDRAREYLVCWIPPTFINTAEDGIAVNPVACIDWLPEVERELGLDVNPSA